MFKLNRVQYHGMQSANLYIVFKPCSQDHHVQTHQQI